MWKLTTQGYLQSWCFHFFREVVIIKVSLKWSVPVQLDLGLRNNSLHSTEQVCLSCGVLRLEMELLNHKNVLSYFLQLNIIFSCFLHSELLMPPLCIEWHKHFSKYLTEKRGKLHSWYFLKTLIWRGFEKLSCKIEYFWFTYPFIKRLWRFKKILLQFYNIKNWCGLNAPFG